MRGQERNKEAIKKKESGEKEGMEEGQQVSGHLARVDQASDHVAFVSHPLDPKPPLVSLTASVMLLMGFSCSTPVLIRSLRALWRVCPVKPLQPPLHCIWHSPTSFLYLAFLLSCAFSIQSSGPTEPPDLLFQTPQLHIWHKRGHCSVFWEVKLISQVDHQLSALNTVWFGSG